MNWQSWNGPLITVCTPTFNRAHCLDRVYESLLSQSFKNFEWIVVDDGSTDDTAELVQRWQTDPEGFFPIYYIYQTNQHKKVAVNRGVSAARGFFFICADSDDSFPYSALSDFIEGWSSISVQDQDLFAGVVGLVEDETGKLVGSRFPEAIDGALGFDSDLQEIRYRFRVRGEKWGMTRTQILREIRYPEDISGRVPDGVIWSRIGARYRTRFINKIVRRYYRGLPDSGQSISTSFEPSGWAEGMVLYKRIILTEEIRWFWYAPLHFMLEAARYVRFLIHNGRLPDSVDGREPKRARIWMALMVTILSPVGLAWFLCDWARIFRRRLNRAQI